MAQNEAGYLNLLKLVSKAFMETEAPETPQVSMDDIERWSSNLIALTGGIHGAVGRSLGEGHMPKAEATLLRLAGIFPGRLYVECSAMGWRSRTASSRA